MPKRALVVLVSALTILVPVAGSLSACQVIDEKPCMPDEYPARAKGGGAACFQNGQRPDSPYETYPPGYTPTTIPIDNPAPDATDYDPPSEPASS